MMADIGYRSSIEWQDAEAKRAREDDRAERHGELNGLAWLQRMAGRTEGNERQAQISMLKYDAAANEYALANRVLSQLKQAHMLVELCSKCGNPALTCYLEGDVCPRCRLAELEAD